LGTADYFDEDEITDPFPVSGGKILLKNR